MLGGENQAYGSLFSRQNMNGNGWHNMCDVVFVGCEICAQVPYSRI